MVRSVAIRSLLLTLLALVLLAAPAAAAPTIDGEFPVKGLETNGKITEGPDGNMWVALRAAGKDVAKITPAGAVTEYDLEAVTAAGIAVGPEGRIWITRNGAVISFDPADPEVTKKLTPVAEIGTAHSIVRGPDNNMWVATNGKVLRIQASDPTQVQPFPVAKLDPKDIDTAGSLLAVADAGEPRIVTLTTAGAVTEYKIPGGSQGVAGTAAGLISFSQQGNVPEQFGLIQPPTLLPLIDTPGGVGDPFGVALGSDQAFWFAMTGNDGVARVAQNGQFTLLNGFPKESFARQVASGPNNTIWVTLARPENPSVARISGLEPPQPPPPPPPGTKPETRIGKGPKGVVKTTKGKAKVSFRFSSSDPAASFQCRVIGLTPKGTGKKKAGSSKKPKIKLPAFKACKSPRSYKLKPGRYRFQVRAVNAAGPDPTPAKRTFKVVRVYPID